MKIDFKKYLLYFISTIIVAVIILSMLWLGHFEIYRDFILKSHYYLAIISLKSFEGGIFMLYRKIEALIEEHLK